MGKARLKMLLRVAISGGFLRLWDGFGDLVEVSGAAEGDFWGSSRLYGEDVSLEPDVLSGSPARLPLTSLRSAAPPLPPQLGLNWIGNRS